MLEVIAGCMYSGKSEELIRRLRRCKIAGQKVWAFKPAIDARYSATSISTHPVEGLGDFFEAVPVTGLADFIEHLQEVSLGDVVGFDEVQFMDKEVVGVFEKIANLGIRVIVAGLDLDSEGVPFGPIGDLLARADSVTKLTAVCTAPTPGGSLCGKPATKSFRAPEFSNGNQVQVGSLGVYEARCRSCWGPSRNV
jgi:thymidine kinase